MNELPRLRPIGRHKAYYDELRQIFEQEGEAIQSSVELEKVLNDGKLSIVSACRIALKHELRLSALFNFIEDRCGVPSGTYDRLKERGLKPMILLREEWERMCSSKKH